VPAVDWLRTFSVIDDSTCTLPIILELALARLIKEAAYYQQEVKDNERKLEEMKNCKKDPYDIKRFEQVLAESYMMVPDSSKRLQQALEDLASFVQSAINGEQAVDEAGEWFVTAKQVLKDHYQQSKKDTNEAPGADAVVETNVDDLAIGEAFWILM